MKNWDGAPIVSVTLETAIRLAAATKPRYGGEIVEELRTIAGDDVEMIYRWSHGDVIEMCDDGAYVHPLGHPMDTVKISIELIARAGDEWADEYEIERQTKLDEIPSPSLVDAVFDDVFAHLLPLSSPQPANQNTLGGAE